MGVGSADHPLVRIQPVPRFRTIHPAVWLAVIVAALAAGWAVVWAAGGTKTAKPHLLYVPVVIASFVGGVRAGAMTGLAAGLLMGPLMPLDTSAGQAQTLGGWALRMAFFVIIGVIVGEGRRQMLRTQMTRQKFVSAVAHEVRTPLSAVVGFSQIITDRYDDLPEPDLREFVQVINREAGELQDIIEGYIIAARIGSQDLVFEPEVVELDQAVLAALGRLPDAVVQTKVNLALQPIECWADPVRARQAIRALVGHCLAYVEGDLEISTKRDGRHAV
ncbi:MAG TPA: HAMP domain-containing sensor histidine kinase, partial [Acidimicrobiia bacterium]|nr:HAMP domain-containing sensor histidine kinase [Acidimicrobiia bacterium]